MGLLDRIREKREKSVLPDEVRQYYQSEHRQRRGVAIILAIIALIITVAIAAGVFFAGRAIYRQIKGDDGTKGQTSSTSTNKPSDQNNKPKDEEKKGSDANSAPTPSASTPTPAPATTPNPSVPSTTPSLGDTPTLPHTGDEGL